MAGDAHGLDEDSGCLKVRLLEGHNAVRVTTAFNMLLSLSGVNVTAVVFQRDRVVVDVRLRRRRLVCPHCGWSTRWRYDTQPKPSTCRAIVLSLLIGQLGPVLQLDQWVLDLSPFTHLPQLPGDELVWGPLLWLTAVALGLAVLGLVGLRRRDVG